MSIFSNITKLFSYSLYADRHRRQRVSLSGLLSYWVQWYVRECYYVGVSAERIRKRTARHFRKARRSAVRRIKLALVTAFKYIAGCFKSVFGDLAKPFIKLWKSFKSFIGILKEIKGQSRNAKAYRIRYFFRNGWKRNKYLVSDFMNYVLPVISLGICFLTVSYIINLNFVVAVSSDGDTIGYVENESVYNSAVKTIESQLANIEDNTWHPSSILTISVSDGEECLNETEMTNLLLATSGSEIVEATGVYVGGQFIGATTAGELLQSKLENVLIPYQSQASQLGKDITVKFTRRVDTVTGIYPTDSLISFDDLCEIIDSNETEDRYYSAAQGEDISEILSICGISLTKLQSLNPGVDLDGDVMQADVNLLVGEDQVLFSVKMVGTIVETQSIAFQSKVIKEPSQPLGYYQVNRQGVAGERTIITEVEYEDGIEVSRNVVSNKVTRSPVNNEVVVGTGGVSSDEGALLWPCARHTCSRGFTAGYHLGIDIYGPYGTPIYAAEDGVVTVATRLQWDYGLYCIVDHGNGMTTVYGHCSSLLVSVGDTVKRGQVIALMGSTGNSTGNHLHFEVRVNGVKVDPEIYIKGAIY